MLSLLFRAVAHRHYTAGLLCGAMVLMLPSLWQGWMVDDVIHRMVLQGLPGVLAPSPTPWMELFSFFPKPMSSSPIMALIGEGGVPWWSSPQLEITFWRPLTALTHLLDYRLWPRSPALMHLHSLLWYGLLAGLAVGFYRWSAKDASLAGVAAFLYVLNDAFSFPVGWIANRSALLAACFGLGALWLHHRWRSEGWRWGIVAAPCAYALGLLSAEAAVGICGYFGAYALFWEEGPWRPRLLSLLPYVLLTVAWRLLYKSLGYGVKGSGMYNDPLADPLHFLWIICKRLPLLLLGQWGTPSPMAYTVLPAEGRWVLWGWALLWMLALLLVLGPLWRERRVRFWAMGMLVALVPVCATHPNERLLLFSNLGAMGILAHFFGLWTGASPRLPQALWWRRLARGMVAAWVVIHLLLDPLMMTAKLYAMPTIERILVDLQDDIQTTAARRHEPIIVINSVNSFFDLNVLARRADAGQPIPTAWYSLSPGTYGVRVVRTGPRSLSIRPHRGFVIEFDALFRSVHHPPFRVGQKIQRRHVTARILSLTPDGRPLKVDFAFRRELEHSSLHFYKGTPTGYRPFQPPPLGRSVTLPSTLPKTVK